MTRCFAPDGLAAALPAQADGSRRLVAYSGGLDSSVLLHALAALEPGAQRLGALHVNHQLHPDADRWQAHCAAACRALGVAFQSVTVDARPRRRESPEAAARRARYAAFAAALQPGDTLLLAHHADDQLETLLLNLLRGSGSRGLAGMPVSRPLGDGRLHRPLLRWPRAALQAYARDAGLAWIEDPSNAATTADRNHLRHAVMPALRERWPDVAERAGRAAAQLEEDAGLLAELAGLDLGGAAIHPPGTAVLPLARLAALSPARRSNALRAALRARGLEPLPSGRRLREFARQLVEARDDRGVELQWAGGVLRREGLRVWLLDALPPPPQTPVSLRPGVDHADACGRVWLSPVADAPGAAAEGACLLSAAELAAGVTLEYRRGGERLGRGRGRRLTPLLQARRVPGWLRPRLPLVRAAGQLVGVAGCHPRLNPPGLEDVAAWRVCWRPAPALLPGLVGHVGEGDL